MPSASHLNDYIPGLQNGSRDAEEKGHERWVQFLRICEFGEKVNGVIA
jgi:hypothetical protein